MNTELFPKIKPYSPTFVRKDDRGVFTEILNEGPWETVIHGKMKKGATMGKHYHRECRAFFYLIDGKASIRVFHLVDKTAENLVLIENSGVYFLPFVTHAVTYLMDSTFLLLKSYRYKDDEPDIYPFEI